MSRERPKRNIIQKKFVSARLILCITWKAWKCRLIVLTCAITAIVNISNHLKIVRWMYSFCPIRYLFICGERIDQRPQMLQTDGSCLCIGRARILGNCVNTSVYWGVFVKCNFRGYLVPNSWPQKSLCLLFSERRQPHFAPGFSGFFRHPRLLTMFALVVPFC